MNDLNRTKVKSTTLSIHNRINNNKVFLTHNTFILQYLRKKYSGKSNLMLYVHRLFLY